VIDALRGFALCGILVMNIEFFSRPLQGIALGFDRSLSGMDYDVAWWVMALVQGKFWILFSLLFGAGLALMSERAEQHAAPFERIQIRRLGWLLVIGLIHAVLIWAGDILVFYAIGGFALLLMVRSVSVGLLWKLGLVLYVAPLGLLWLGVGAMQLAALDPGAAQELAQEMTNARDQLQADGDRAALVYASGSLLDATRQRFADAAMQYGWLPGFFPTLLGVFLLGAWSVRSGVLTNARAHTVLWRRLLLIGGVPGLLVALHAMPVLTVSDPMSLQVDAAWATTQMSVASLMLSLAYASGLLLLMGGPWPMLVGWLAPMGRMALSNYLLQSLCFSLLFYGYGLGLWSQISRVDQLLIVAAYLVLQIAWSRYWMARFRHGPVEWIWRALTYRQRPSMRL
jgi:uncharacterized protein